MASNKPTRKKRFFTVCEANALLPLIRAIVRDITALAADLQERHDRLVPLLPSNRVSFDQAHGEELRQVQTEFERDQERMREYQEELEKLGVELKDWRTGLVDFRTRMDNREVYLCWRLGEPEILHWHELEAGFSGRQKLMVDASSS